jgi:copper(I)-binding protein
MTIKNATKYLTLVLLCLAGGSILNASCAPGDMIAIQSPWARANVAEKGNSAVYMHIKNEADQDDELIRAEADVCGRVEMHESVQEGDISKMVKVDHICLPAKETVSLKPGGYHIMLLNLREGLKVGDVVQVTLHFKNSPSKTVQAEVKKMKEKSSKCTCKCGCPLKKKKKSNKKAKKSAKPKVESCHEA